MSEIKTHSEPSSAPATGAPKASLCFQDMILTLHAFWAAQGCLILQPYDMRVGAGTLAWKAPVGFEGVGVRVAKTMAF